jgi:DNA-binding CsgD family transcriptional regulator/type II secretory pathway predicted ATPase ExeA
VARGEELGLLTHELLAGEAGGVALLGAAGVGKTRLVREALRCAAERGSHCVWVTATRAARSIPFGAFAGLMPLPKAGGLDRLELLFRARRALVEAAGPRRLVMAVDDAHLLDEASATLVHQLALTGQARLVVTLRTGEPAPDAVTVLWKDARLAYLELKPFSRADVEVLLSTGLGGAVAGTTAEELWQATHGNILFIRELVRAGLASGALVFDGGLWRWHGPIAGDGRLADLIDMRLSALSRDEQAALEIIATAEAVGDDLLDEMADRDTVVALRRRGLLDFQVGHLGTFVALAHPLYAEAARGRMSSRRRREICSLLADALDARGLLQGTNLLRVANWRLQAGRGGDPALFVAAARRAMAALDLDLAERFARAAVRRGGGMAAEEVLGSALGSLGRTKEADTLLGRLEPQALSDAQRGLIAQLRASTLFYSGRVEEALAIAQRAETVISDSSARDELIALRSIFAMFAGQPVEALGAALPMLARRGVEERVAVLAALSAAPALGMRGRTSDALDVVERWLPAARRVAEALPFGEFRLTAGRAYSLWIAGRLPEALAVDEAGYREAVVLRMHEPTGVWAMASGGVLTDMGLLRRAALRLSEAVAVFRDFDPTGYLPWALAFLAGTLALSGQAQAAEAAIAEARTAQRLPRFLAHAELGWARTWAAAARGELSNARRIATESADDLEARGCFGQAVRALHDVARLGDAGAVTGRITGLATHCDGPIASAYHEHARALAAGDTAGLQRAAWIFEDLGAVLHAAEAYAEAARTHQAHGRSAAARLAAARGRGLADRCEGVRTPALIDLQLGPSLSTREHEIAMLAASGLSNRDIARRLTVSVRTVDAHLQHVYGKLGVHNRREAASILGVQP